MVLLEVQFIPFGGPSYRFIIAGTIFSIAWTFHLSKRLCPPPPPPLWKREEGKLVAGASTVWWMYPWHESWEEEEEEEGGGKSVRVKAIFRRSRSTAGWNPTLSST